MAIIVEGEKQKGPLSTIIILIVVVIVLAVGSYYLFFSPAPAIQGIIVPSDLQSIAQVSKVDINIIQSLTSSATYNNLKSTLPAQQLSTSGRSDPFQIY
jgi:flagellar basal body-associated protein FliL